MSKNAITTKVNLRGMKKKIDFIKSLSSGNVLQEAANMLANEAYIVMYNQYLGTSGKRYKNNRNRYTIENTVFSGVPKAEITRDGVQISLIADYDKVKKRVPHLDWQEHGTSSTTDKQPYLIQRSRLRAIKKSMVGRHDVFMGSSKNYNQHVGAVTYLNVNHPALKPRHFILAGSYFLKTQGASFIRNYILSRMKQWQ